MLCIIMQAFETFIRVPQEQNLHGFKRIRQRDTETLNERSTSFLTASCVFEKHFSYLRAHW